jgi:hypothetical protein
VNLAPLLGQRHVSLTPAPAVTPAAEPVP